MRLTKCSYDGRTLAITSGVLLACALCLPARAQWSSVRANNRAAAGQRFGGRSAAMAAPAQRQETEHRAFEGVRPAGRGHEEREHEERGREMERGRIGESRTGREFFEHRVPEREHWEFEERHHAYPWFGISPGVIIGTLPQNYEQIYVGGNPYYYDQGVYYQPGSSGYVVVTPPIGAIVPQLPAGAEPIQVGPTIYYYAGGAFYVQQPQGFAVVTPPLGISVAALPPGAVQVNINGTIYYQADGAYFAPMIQNGITVYTTVQP